jgi:hypothetical protein
MKKQDHIAIGMAIEEYLRHAKMLLTLTGDDNEIVKLITTEISVAMTILANNLLKEGDSSERNSGR